MRRVIVYIDNPSSAEERLLQRLLARSLNAFALPIISDPIPSDEQLKSVLGTFDNSTTLSDRFAIVVTPEELSSMAGEEAIQAIKSHASWRELLKSFEVDSARVRFQMKEHPRFWVVAALVENAGIPPGVGFLVDKFSGSVFARRLADIYSDDGELL